MVVTRQPALEAVRATVVPDPEHWTLSGIDVRSLGYTRADSPEHAELLLVPDRIPDALRAAVLQAWSRLPEPRRFLPLDGDFPGVPAEILLRDADRRGDTSGEAPDGYAGGGTSGPSSEGDIGDHTSEGDTGGPTPEGDMGGHTSEHQMEGHDHHDMMAIVGDPSADGLVMESIDTELGPLSPALPGGLVAQVSLDGDVVADCRLRATLTAPRSMGDAASAGPGATAALEAAVATARERIAGTPAAESTERRRVAAIELERALAHASWLRSFGAVLGWGELADRAQAAVEVLLEPRMDARRALGRAGDAPGGWAAALPAAASAVERLVGLVDGSRRLRARAGGRAETPASMLSTAPIGGPVARAAGLARDARIGDPTYDRLGFEPELEEAADAAARTVVRAREVRQAVALAAAAASEAGASEPRAAAPVARALTVEGPRGPLRVNAGPGQHSMVVYAGAGQHSVTAPGATEALELAGASARGLELASALVGIASFDLSPWRVGP